jgi:hypothetical protein
MADWTKDMVEDRVVEAAAVLRHIPPPQVAGYFSTWPEVVRSFGDLVGQEPVALKPRPSPAAITRMEEAITWNRFLERDDAALMWARADGMQWKPICHRFGIARATAHRRWEYALSVVAWRLNGREPHLRRGAGFVIEKARAP